MKSKFVILVVEDHHPDAALINDAFQSLTVPYEAHFVVDGVEAMAFLRREGHFMQAPRPHMVLLDRHMPRKDGYEVLLEVRADAFLKGIPILMMASTNLAHDVHNLYAGGANAFFYKPFDPIDMVRLIKSVEAFWFREATIP